MSVGDGSALATDEGMTGVVMGKHYVVAVDDAGYTYEDHTRSSCTRCGNVEPVADMYEYDGAVGIFCETCDMDLRAPHWHVAAFLPGCLNDSDEGPFDNFSDALVARDELAETYYGDETIVKTDPYSPALLVTVHQTAEHAERGMGHIVEVTQCREPLCRWDMEQAS